MILSTAKEESDFAAAMVARLPATIRIGPYDFRVNKFTAPQAAAAQRYGECSSVEQQISIQEWFPSRYKALDTVLHEIMHAIFWSQGLQDDDKEERTVSLMATGWCSFFRDNPWFFDWLKSAEV